MNKTRIDCRCPALDCGHEFEIDVSDIGKTLRCTKCKGAFSARSLDLWQNLSARENAFRNNHQTWIAQKESSPISLGSKKRKILCYRQNDSVSHDERMDLQYEAGKDLVKPRMDRVDELVIVCDDLRSQWNVGACFRTAEGLGFGAIHLTGITPMPPAKGLLRVSLGAEKKIYWDYHANALELFEKLKNQGFCCAALEQTADAIDLNTFVPPAKLALFIGNEVGGISAELLERIRLRIEIPMYGHKASFNAAVALGMAANQISTQWRKNYL